ncbi:MAG: hypothetical protein ACTSQK_11505 [Candidatus Heimdallarchaeota archaeon]
MKKIKKKNLHIILLVWIIIPLFLSVPNNILNYEMGPIKHAGWGSNEDWHEDDNKTTTEVDIFYTESMGVDPDSGLDMLAQRMVIHYTDGTNAAAGFLTRFKFNEGGIVLGEVANWSKIKSTEPTFYSSTPNSNQTVNAEYKFNGFGIYKGNSSNIALVNHTLSHGWELKLNESTKIGQIDVAKNYKVGAVSLSTTEVPFEGNNVTQSIAKFDIIINATIGNTTHTHDIPVIYKFEVRHMINETRYKFGVDINWTGIEDFPTELNMNIGDEYYLVANDRLSVGIETSGITTFDSNAENDTAIFLFEDEEICRQYFTTAFKINLTGSDTSSTSRFYLQNASYHSPGSYLSRVYVFFDAFRYGQSNGISYDPTVVVPCDYTPATNGGDPPLPNDDNLISFSNLFLVFLTISVIALAIIVKKRKKTISF